MTGRQFKLSVAASVFLISAFIVWPSLTAAQSTTVEAAQDSQPASKSAGVSVQIASGDTLDISVFDVPELTQQVHVGPDGTAQLALIGSTRLAGMTAQEAADAIGRELRDRNFLVRPQVNVVIKESAMQGVSVVGEVQHPGIYPIVGSRTLLDVISLAGGLTNVADTKVTIKHRAQGTGSVTVSLRSDDANSSLAADVQVNPGDMVVVPRAGIVYVMGDVARPGGFVMQSNGKITLLEAVAQAGSVLSSGSAGHAILLRKTDDGYTTTKVDIDKIAHGKEADFPLHANDIVFVPNSKLKSAMRNTGVIASSAATASIYAIIH